MGTGSVGADLAWCAADLHLGRNDPVLGVFLDWLREFERGDSSSLVLLGDVFRVWIGFESAEGPEQEQVLSALGRLTAAGRRVVYLPGNRDYFVEERGRRAGLVVVDRWDLESASGTVRFEHGDLINTSDRRYLRWRRLSRARLTRLLFKALPAVAQASLAGRIEARFARTNLPYKAYDPAAELGAWARTVAAGGIASAVLGHFHLDEEREVGGLKIRFLPQFREEGLHLRIAGDGSQRLLGAGARAGIPARL